MTAILALAAALRFVGADSARDEIGFRPRLDADGDIIYHAARARFLASSGEVLWSDRGLDPPHGARVLWPPLLEGIIVGSAWLATGGAPRPIDVDAASALVPVALGVLSVAVMAVLGFLVLGPGHGLLSALGLAVSWGAIFYSFVGRTDQHVLEMLLFVAVSASAVWAVRAGAPGTRRARAVLLGSGVALSFWNWQGSALTLLVLAVAAAVDHVMAPGPEPAGRRFSVALAEGSLAGAALLAISIAVLGPAGALRSGAIEGVSALSVATCAATAVGAATLAIGARRPGSRARRLAEAAMAAALGTGALLAVPAMRAGVVHGLLPLGRANPWYAAIHEFQPMFFGEVFTASQDLRFALDTLGLMPLLAVVGAASFPGAARREPERRTALLLLATMAAALVFPWVARRRFDLYVIVPLVVLAAAGARSLSGRALGARARRWVTAGAGVLLLLAAAPTVPSLKGLARVQDPGVAPVVRISERLRARGARGVVLCSWSRGHHVRFASGLFALVTPFGSDAGPDSMADWARFMAARTESEAEAALAARDVRWVLIEPLLGDLLLAHRLAPLGPAPVEIDPVTLNMVLTPEGESLVAARLLWNDGNAASTVPALEGYRLVDEDSRPERADLAAKLFERVRGARVTITGATPGARVDARVGLLLPTGRRTSLALSTNADQAGRATLRLPYSSGANGRVEATSWRFSSSGRSGQLVVAESAVLEGGETSLPLG